MSCNHELGWMPCEAISLTDDKLLSDDKLLTDASYDKLEMSELPPCPLLRV